MSTPTPTQVQHPWRAALRTGFAILLSLSAFLTVALPMALPVLEAYLPANWVGYVVGAVGVVSALAGLVTRLMATAELNDLLTKIGLGATPKIED